jgi:hypothetical protein
MATLDHSELQRRLMRALDVAGKTHGPEDVARAVADGRMQAWTAGDSLVITEVLNFPQARALNVFLAVGNLDEVMSLQPAIEAFGREHGCSVMRMEGRKGWARVLPDHGWKQDKKVIYERTLTDG